MYQIKCDDHVLYDPRDDALTVKSPKCKLAINTVGSASFAIYSNHPHYKDLNKLKSVFEIRQDDDVIFRGRMTEDSKDFHNKQVVDLEGAMAYFNDSMVRPFDFPGDYASDPEYEYESRAGNVVKCFFSKLIQNHNSQVEPFQQFKVGRVTVSDPNNYITRSDTSYKKTWEILKEKLFESSLGGYLCIRYEDDGNYIDYLSEFDSDNTQKIVFGENILDLSVDSDATETYTAIIPLGVENSTTKKKLTISSLGNGFVRGTEFIRKDDTIYNPSAVAKFGWIYAPVSDTTWDDVGTPEALQDRGVEYLESKASRFWETLSITAIDLHLSNREIEAFRIYKNVYVESTPHDQNGKHKLSELDIDIENPQNTKITVGEKKRVLTDKTSEVIHRVETVNSKTNIDLSNKVGKADDSQVITMINRAKEVVQFLANRLVIESSNFTLSEEGSVVANDIKLKNSNGNYFVNIDAGIITTAGEGIFVQEEVRDFPIMNFRVWDHYYAVCVRCFFGEHPDGSYDWIPDSIIFRQSNYEDVSVNSE